MGINEGVVKLIGNIMLLGAKLIFLIPAAIYFVMTKGSFLDKFDAYWGYWWK
ncbi:MAG: hypothetical protein ABIB71_00015 [Candidatus Woesearchaeota archaeon]